MGLSIKIGDPVPAFSGTDANGQTIASKKLLGRPYVLYFYPKDDTPGCTKQACSFRDAKEQTDALNVLVIGVSPDSKESHQKFMEKYGLNFTLITDSDQKICNLFGVWQEKTVFGKTGMGVVRSTFIVDAEGIVRWIESPVEVEGQIERILQALKQLNLTSAS